MALDYEKVTERARSFFSESVRFPAGAEYLRALTSLGLDPDVMCWIYISSEDRMELAIVTTMVDRIGPLPIYELLFKAYDASALPHEIDPFEVSLYSPNTRMGIDLMSIKVTNEGMIYNDGSFPPTHITAAWINIGIMEPMIVPGVGVYRVKHTVRNADQDRVRWNRFKNNVEALAA
jgi:hypothetical protein